MQQQKKTLNSNSKTSGTVVTHKLKFSFSFIKMNKQNDSKTIMVISEKVGQFLN